MEAAFDKKKPKLLDAPDYLVEKICVFIFVQPS
jgi:hypothetical protein